MFTCAEKPSYSHSSISSFSWTIGSGPNLHAGEGNQSLCRLKGEFCSPCCLLLPASSTLIFSSSTTFSLHADQFAGQCPVHQVEQIRCSYSAEALDAD